MQSDREDMCAFLLVEMAAIGAISFGQTNKVFKANIAEVKKKTEKAISDDMTYVCSSERQF